MNTIRTAQISDAGAILGIYGPFVSKTAITFEMEAPSLETMEQRITHYQEKWPWLVSLQGDRVVGYAYATHHRERAAYQWCVESSVYIDPQFHGRGIAGNLYQVLFEILRYQGFVNVYAGITLPNVKSVQFHRKLGFTWIGDYKNIGYKLNLWHTVSWWELALNPYLIPPSPLVAFAELDPSITQSLLKNPPNERG
jgi:L-amino acid N-acyltransferase YncA